MELLHLLFVLMLLVCGTALLPSVHSVEEESPVPIRAKRDADTELSMNISFTVNVFENGTCYGGNSAGLGSTDLTLEYRNNASDFQWVEIADNISIGENFSTAVNIPGSGCVVVRLVQEEHGGGDCNCWEVTSIELNSVEKNISQQCGGAASVPRSVNWTLGSDATSDCNVMSTILTKPFNTTTCTGSSPYINITFQLNLENDSCDSIDFFDEGVEFSIQINSKGAWIPIILASKNVTKKDRFAIGEHIDEYNVVIRGFGVESKLAINKSYYSVQVCDFTVPVNSIQFRWLQTSRIGNSSTAKVNDPWALDNVHVSHHNNNVSVTLLQDLFDDPDLNTTNWSPSNIRNGNVSTMCAAKTNNSALVFGLNSRVYGSGLVSRSVKTGIIPVKTTVATTMAATTDDTALPTTMAATTDDVITTAPPTTMNAQALALRMQAFNLVLQEEAVINEIIRKDPVLNATFTLPPAQALNELAAVVSDVERDDDEVVVIYLLGSILNRTTNQINLPSNVFLWIGSNISHNNEISVDNDSNEFNVVGSSLLAILDDFAFDHFEQEDYFATGNIVLQTRQLSTDSVGQEDLMTAIDSSDYSSFSQPRMSIEIPPDLVKMFRNMSGMGSNGVRLGSFLYANVTGLFHNASLPGENGSELALGIVSTGLQCGTGRCPTDDLQLDTPVRITIEHSDTVKERLVRDNTSEVKCVFLDILATNILSAGQWSDRGCARNENLSNNSITVCECDHLTHFAILLSAAPLNLTDAVVLSLEIIGYVGVSVSLVAMGLTIFTFVAFKSLRNMRNYIHINLCINLGIAQLIFVAGVDQSASDHVPIHCQVIAVLLHYFFLVSFMWMLMEGVVLYVALVRVFVKHKKRYLFAFTTASYGIPLLYLGLLTLPLGFALPTQPNYGYNTACFLNSETNFIWAFIAPVIVIIFINVGFFIMAASIMWRQQKKQPNNSDLYTIKNWLKAAVSLVVIMGLTWIFGVLIVEVEELVPLAYIYTIMVAFQGLFIFLIFVVLSKQVREAFTKCWRAKVNESDILSKYFGEKTLSTLKSANRSAPSKEATANRAVLKQSTDSELKEGSYVSGHCEDRHSVNGLKNSFINGSE